MSTFSPALAAILADCHDDAPNARLSKATTTVALADLDYIGLVTRMPVNCPAPLPEGVTALTTLAEILEEDYAGIQNVTDNDPSFAMDLQDRRTAFAGNLYHVITPTRFLASLKRMRFSEIAVYRRLKQNPLRHNRLLLATVASHYGLPIVSSNRYYVHLRRDIPLPAGVFDPVTGEWALRPTNLTDAPPLD
ncbi:hypothetical protein DK26_01135 [Bosea sp. WAO]|uniref:hypothetical protein n=1 Tax=Bosea sp. WAO TaxID=406341 RepID=UPI0007472205|nr:hypothetical protein [Bosea sp. WAO]KUL97308.1 hypothetical protein DK26_01135 [Bosea sp. WAO]